MPTFRQMIILEVLRGFMRDWKSAPDAEKMARAAARVADAIEAQEKKPPKKRKQFKPPTIDEVRGYCKERQNAVDPQIWLDHYESNGWRVGKVKMSDWKASVRNWEKRNVNGEAPKKTVREYKADVAKRAGDEKEMRAYLIIKAARASGTKDEDIRVILADRGLTWPGE